MDLRRNKNGWVKGRKNTSVTPTKARSLQTFPVSAWAQESTYFIKLKQNSTSKTVSSVGDNQQAPCRMLLIDHQQTMEIAFSAKQSWG